MAPGRRRLRRNRRRQHPGSKAPRRPEKVVLRREPAPPAVAARGLERKPRAILSLRLKPHPSTLRADPTPGPCRKHPSLRPKPHFQERPPRPNNPPSHLPRPNNPPSHLRPRKRNRPVPAGALPGVALPGAGRPPPRRPRNLLPRRLLPPRLPRSPLPRRIRFLPQRHRINPR